jgi:hypothetical protein
MSRISTLGGLGPPRIELFGVRVCCSRMPALADEH